MLDSTTPSGALILRKIDGRIGTLVRIDGEHAYITFDGTEGDTWAGTLDAWDIPTDEQVIGALRLRDVQNASQGDMLDNLRRLNTNQAALLEDERARVVALIREKTDAEVDAQMAREAVTAANRRHADDVALIGERLLEEAESRSWCEEYDSAIDDLNAKLHVGLPRRLKDFDVYVPVQVMVRVSVSAYDEQGAQDEAGNDWRDRWDREDARDIITEGSTMYDADFTVEEI